MIYCKFLQFEFHLHLIRNCDKVNLHLIFNVVRPDTGGIAVKRVGLWPLAYWDCGFEFLRGDGCLL